MYSASFSYPYGLSVTIYSTCIVHPSVILTVSQSPSIQHVYCILRLSLRSHSHHLFNMYTASFIYPYGLSVTIYILTILYSVSFTPTTFIIAVTRLQDTISDISSWITSNLLSLNPSKTQFLLKLTLLLLFCQTLQPALTARNLGFIFNTNLKVSRQISFLSSACNYHIRDLCRISHTLDLKTASTIATSLIHSKLDYCNSLYLKLSKKQISHLRLLQNSLVP